MTENVIVVWCESPLGLISTRVDENNVPFVHNSTELDVVTCYDEDEALLFDYLNRRDGTKIAIPIRLVESFLGWTTDAPIHQTGSTPGHH